MCLILNENFHNLKLDDNSILDSDSGSFLSTVYPPFQAQNVPIFCLREHQKWPSNGHFHGISSQGASDTKKLTLRSRKLAPSEPLKFAFATTQWLLQASKKS